MPENIAESSSGAGRCVNPWGYETCASDPAIFREFFKQCDKVRRFLSVGRSEYRDTHLPDAIRSPLPFCSRVPVQSHSRRRFHQSSFDCPGFSLHLSLFWLALNENQAGMLDSIQLRALPCCWSDVASMERRFERVAKLVLRACDELAQVACNLLAAGGAELGRPLLRARAGWADPTLDAVT
eukprot:6203221-Pleurochrysis_carterae.AAC.1